MSEQMNQPKQILWMAEELDFELRPEFQTATTSKMQAFLASAAGTGLAHSIYPAYA